MQRISASHTRLITSCFTVPRSLGKVAAPFTRVVVGSMRHLFRVSIFTFALGTGLLALNARTEIHGDPTDDLSFLITHASATQGYTRVSVRQVAEVLRHKMKGYPAAKSKELAKHLIRLCQKHRFDPAFILSLIQVESGFRKSAVSHRGAVGLMQIMPGTARFVSQRYGIPYGGVKTLDDPFINLSLGMAYLKWLKDKYSDRSHFYHIAAYNIGPGRLDELLSRGALKPTHTLRYYESIMKGVPALRSHLRRKA